MMQEIRYRTANVYSSISEKLSCTLVAAPTKKIGTFAKNFLNVILPLEIASEKINAIKQCTFHRKNICKVIFYSRYFDIFCIKYLAIYLELYSFNMQNLNNV